MQVENDQASGAMDAGSHQAPMSLEEQLVNSMKDQPEAETEDMEGVAESDGGDAVSESANGAPDDADVPAFELSKDVSLKVGDALTAEHLKALEDGALRMKDYTQKTQALSEQQREVQEVLQARDAIAEDPRALFNYVEPKHVIQAFPVDQLLVYSLQQKGIDPNAWNSFLEAHQAEGGEVGQGWQAKPYAGELEELKHQLHKVTQDFTNYRQQQSNTAAQQTEKQQMHSLESEVADAVKGNQAGITREDVLKEMATGDDRDAAAIVKELTRRYDQRYNAYVKTKQEQRRHTAKQPRGHRVPVMPKAPKTFDDANQTIERLLESNQI